jgi:hypothetical protein
MKNLLLAFVIVLLVSACGTPATTTPTNEVPPPAANNAPVEQATPVCISQEPTDADVDRALTYTKDLFSGANWERSYTVGGGRVTVTWFNGADAAIAYLEALIFPCLYEEPDLNSFFSTENWQIVFANYESYQPVAECRTDDGLRLYQFSAIEQGYEYAIKYWVKNDTDTRVLGMMIVFPAESTDLMDEFSNSLFPELTSCQ